MDLASPSTADSTLDAGLPQEAWIQPVPDARVIPPEADPAELAAARETLKLAFVAALQHLPARQRAVLILREVLRWQATEVAELLETSVASVNSALQRARATLDELDLDASGPAAVDDESKQEFLARYVAAFEAYDINEVVKLLHQDVTFNMPPFTLWLQGPDQVYDWMTGPGIGCANARLRVTSANGCPAVGIYKTTDGRLWEPFNIAVLDISNGGIAGITHFIYPELFEAFGLPARIEE
jgi:RNA polymerase sigma-70 factor (ECF subfamily)